MPTVSRAYKLDCRKKASRIQVDHLVHHAAMDPNAPSDAPSNTDFRLRIGLDLGGTKTEIACLNSGGETIFRRRVPSPRGDYPGTVALLAALVREAENHLGIRGTVGVGIPGTISARTGLVRNANSTWLNGQPLKHDLQSALGREVRIQNDANCLAVSEASDGAASGCELVFAAILGTGVGAGIAIKGVAHSGINGIAGEWGHVPLPLPDASEHPGPACWCGRTGCIEAWISGPALAADHLRIAGETLDAQAIASRALDGRCPVCAASLQRWQGRLARSLAMIINTLDPDVIVLGGGLSNIGSIYANLPGLIRPHLFSDEFNTRIVPSLHGDSSGVRGAAWLWPDSADPACRT
jgi:predicted NBD/HSP70 family sugar kinase